MVTMPLRFVHSLGPVLILLAHLGCVPVVVHGLGILSLAWAVALYLVRMLATTAIYHRLVTHRSYLIDRLHWLPPLALAWLSWQLGGAEWLGAFCLSTTLLFHGVATVNSVAHLIGEQPFQTGDAIRNNRWVALLPLGEGWHNFHHGFQFPVRQGFTVQAGAVRLLPDPTFGFIRLLQALGLASRLRMPAEEAILASAVTKTS